MTATSRLRQVGMAEIGHPAVSGANRIIWLSHQPLGACIGAGTGMGNCSRGAGDCLSPTHPQRERTITPLTARRSVARIGVG
jgi:hypothetical protein